MFYSLNSYSQFKVNQPALSGSTPTPPSFADTKSFQFDGVTDYIVPLITSGLDFSGSFTLMAWIKTDAIGSNQFIIDTSTSGSSGNGYSVRINTDGKIKFWSYAVAGLVNSTTVLSASTWYHVACVHDTVGGTNKIYIDGILDNTSSYTFPTASNTTNLRIGRSNLFSGSFDGFINEVGFFGTDLSANINSIFNGGLPDSLTAFNPSSWFRMGEEATWNGSKFVLDNQGSIGGTATSVGITPSDPNPTTDVPLFDNKSFTYDGISDYFQGLSTYSELNGGTKLTLSVWVKPIAGSPKLEYVLSNPRDTTANNSQFALILYEGNSVQFNVQGFNSQYVSGNIGAVTYGAWNHILICVDLSRTIGTEGIMFINGVDETTTSAMGTLSSFYIATDVLHIGVDANGGYNRFNGNMDELAIWSGSDLRSASDVSSIYNSGVPTDLNNNGLTAPTTYIRGEFATWDGSNWTMIDQGSGANNGTSVSMPLTSRTSDVPI